MADIIEEGFKNIFLAGVGALAITGERAKEVVDSLIEKGGITVEQGKDINAELTHKGSETINKLRADSLAQVLKGMTPEEREEFAVTVAKLVEESKPEQEAPAKEAE